MKNLLLIIVLASAFGCSPRFTDYEAKISETDLPENCKGIIELLESDWKKRKGRKCHYYNGIEVKIVNRYKDCLIGMEVEQIKMIFGEPDLDDSGNFYYNFHKTCPKKLTSGKQLKIVLSDDKVTTVEWSGFLTSY